MHLLKRILLLSLTNLLVVFTLSIVFSVFNISPYLSDFGIDYTQLMIFCLLWGLGGSFISLLLSKTMAKWMMGIKIISRDDGEFQKIYEKIEKISKKNDLKMPEVGIYNSKEMNAFATGPSKNNSLVAISTGLIEKLNDEEVEGVIGHEIAHIKNGDMITMTIIQGVINAFVMFLARVIAWGISSRNSDEDSSGSYFLTRFILEIVLSIFGLILVNYFSRIREFKADLKSAENLGKEKMISALKALQNNIYEEKGQALNTLKITNKPNKFISLFSTHPSLEDRIKTLENIK